MSVNHALFIPVFAAAVAAFCYSCYQRWQLVALGSRENRLDNPMARLWGVLSYAFLQKRVLARPYGVNHLVLFWAFLLLLVANGLFLMEGLYSGAGLAALPSPLRHLLEASFDVVSLAALASVLVALVRRLFLAPSYLGNDYTSPRSAEALSILGMIATLMLAFFVLNAALIAQGGQDTLQPVSALFATALTGLPGQSLAVIAAAAWWVHAVVLLLFMNFLPRSKHMHILTAIPNCFFRSLEQPNVQPRETFARDARFGVSDVDQFTWKDLLDGFSCTECGRCQDVCPAHATGKELNPRRIVHDIKANLLQNAEGLRQGQKAPVALLGRKNEGIISEESLWDCTTCGSCLAVCPVLIEQMPKVIKMRRHLVQEKARFPEELLNLFENIEQRSNPWGIAPSERGKWSTLLGERPFVAGETEYLFFVGCAGALDSRAKQVSVAMATILDAAGVSWGMLGKDELCCGDSVRRLGNEYLFERMAKENVARFRERGIIKVVTQCPHCFTTLKNDYRQYGLEIEVLHHSQLIEQLVAEGKLKPSTTAQIGKTIYHDSCYLGRHNDTYEAPRGVIKAATGTAPMEFDRNREKGFCCGAGGGRMWMEEQSGSRINLERVGEALRHQPDTICVSCPYCMTMMEDGLKDKQDGRVRVRDIAEVMAEAMR